MDYINKKDLDFKEQGADFSTALDTHGIAVGITQDKIDKFNTKKTAFFNALDGHLDAQQAALAATQLKNDTRADFEKYFRELSLFIQNNPDSTNLIIQEFGLPVYDTTPTPIDPVKVDDLKAEGLQSGTIKLNWKKASNKPGTLYVIERKQKDDPAYSYVDTCTATKYEHKGQTPGVFALYRIVAKRGSKLSEPSDEVAVYGAEV